MLNEIKNLAVFESPVKKFLENTSHNIPDYTLRSENIPTKFYLGKLII